MEGQVHLYTGNGKGKTTAAIGLAMRSVGAGRKVFIGQFVKGMHYSELDSLKRIPEIDVQQFGLDCFIKNEPTAKDIEAAQVGFAIVQKMIMSNQYSLVILDELCIAIHYKLISIEDVISFIKQRPSNIEIVITGRYAHEKLFDLADLVTEMKEVKHYYNSGIEARKGIEY